MKRVMSLGLEDDEFFWNGRKKQAVLETFASYVTGWVLQHKIKISCKIFSNSWIILFWFAFCIRESQKLINIRNHDDHNFFELCFTAAFSLRHCIDLLLTDQQKANPAAAWTQPDTYTAESAHKAQDTFDLPMSSTSIGNFEQHNDVQVKVFQYQKGDLLPMYISKRPNNDTNTEIEIFDMDLLCFMRLQSMYLPLICRNSSAKSKDLSIAHSRTYEDAVFTLVRVMKLIGNISSPDKSKGVQLRPNEARAGI